MNIRLTNRLNKILANIELRMKIAISSMGRLGMTIKEINTNISLTRNLCNVADLREVGVLSFMHD